MNSVMDPDPERATYSEVILEHYRKEAEEHGKDASSTMRDEITRGREIAGVLRVIEHLRSRGAPVANMLDIGCGNAYLLEVLRKNHPEAVLTGLEYTPEMVELGRGRGVARCPIEQGDVRALPFADGAFDVVITERCIINVMDRAHQADALHQVARVLRPGGHYLCIEAFIDGLTELNHARDELGLLPNEMPYHNLWFDKPWFLDTIARDFAVVDLSAHRDPSLPAPNFLSSHYFVSRVLYPAITRRPIIYNTHLVKFFSFLPPMGNYAPIQFYLLQKT
jgi:ubiquinone/menaquinone biosynthesis C-methylase UbiE